MTHLIVLLPTVLACLSLSSCVTIPNRPLSSEEQPFVGTWTATTWVPNAGNAKVAIQFSPDHSALYTFRGDYVNRTIFTRWEVINGKLHETDGFTQNVYSDYRFSGSNALRVSSPNVTYNWTRYSSSPQVDVTQAFQKERLTDESSSGGLPGLFDAVTPDGRIIKTGSPEWVAWMKKENAKMDANRTQNGNSADPWDDMRRNQERQREENAQNYNQYRSQNTGL